MFPNALASATWGFQQNALRFNVAAERISNPDGTAGVSEILALKQAQIGIKANAIVISTVNEMSESLVDMLV